MAAFIAHYCWRKTLLNRLHNDISPTPGNNFIEEINDVSEQAWQQLQERFYNFQEAILNWLATNNETGIDEKPAKGNFTRYELLLGIMQHDAYLPGRLL